MATVIWLWLWSCDILSPSYQEGFVFPFFVGDDAELCCLSACFACVDSLNCLPN